MTHDLLTGVWVKINRAKKHAGDLEADIIAFGAREACFFTKEIDANTQKEAHRFRMREPIPNHWSAMAGDCIHNIHSALDHLANALVLYNGGTTTNKTKFPISSAHKHMQSDIPSGLQGASNFSMKMVERLKPYQGANNPFWRIHDLDIVDKHRLLLIVAASHTSMRVIFNPVAMFAKMRPIGAPVPKFDQELFIDINPADRQFPLKDGAILSFSDAVVDRSENYPDVKHIIDIALGEPGAGEGEPIIPTLKQFINFTERVVKIFERHVFK